MKLVKMLLPFALLVLATCSGPNGESYLAFSWVAAPLYFYDQNPSTPGVVTSGSYFHSNAGTYYMEYTAWDSSNWWMNSTISDEPGKPLFEKGVDAYFEITLYSTGPSIWKWSYPYALQETSSRKSSNGSDRAAIMQSKATLSLQKGPTEARDSSSSNGYRIDIEYGRLE